jgi:hypothetical protein
MMAEASRVSTTASGGTVCAAAERVEAFRSERAAEATMGRRTGVRP